jgi:hypothetical protein
MDFLIFLFHSSIMPQRKRNGILEILTNPTNSSDKNANDWKNLAEKKAPIGAFAMI